MSSELKRRERKFHEVMRLETREENQFVYHKAEERAFDIENRDNAVEREKKDIIATNEQDY